jgi:hypothetical protein
LCDHRALTDLVHELIAQSQPSQAARFVVRNGGVKRLGITFVGVIDAREQVESSRVALMTWNPMPRLKSCAQIQARNSS